VEDLIPDGPRLILAVLVMMNAIPIVANMVLRHQMPYTRGVTHGYSQLRLWAPWIPILALLGGLLAGWSQQWNPIVSGIGVVASVVWIRTRFKSSWPPGVVSKQGLYSPSATIVLVLVVCDALQMGFGVGDTHTGWHASAGVLACAWTLLGVQKVRESGWAWAQANNVGLLLAERLYIGPAMRRALSRWILRRPSTLVLLGVMGLGIELLGFAFCIPELRMAYAITVFVFMVFNFVIWGFFEFEWGTVGIAVALGSQL
jgi:hypothetical protein